MFELRCADVYPVRCDEVLSSASRDELLARTRAHGAGTHGFTAAWHSAGRLAAMAEAVSQVTMSRRRRHDGCR
jgi:hypothetical protein